MQGGAGPTAPSAVDLASTQRSAAQLSRVMPLATLPCCSQLLQCPGAGLEPQDPSSWKSVTWDHCPELLPP